VDWSGPWTGVDSALDCMLRTLHTRNCKIDNSAIFAQIFIPMENISLFALFGPKILFYKFLSKNLFIYLFYLNIYLQSSKYS